jgi:hypothetical protein
MTEVLVEFDTILRDEKGTGWAPRACTRIADDGLWEGWIEFIPTNSSTEPVRTGRETEQPSRETVLYWAEGLTQVYLDGALRRALSPVPILTRPEVPAKPAFDSPRDSNPRAVAGTGRHAVLNPYNVYQQGEDILVSELRALATPRLRDIVVAYQFATAAEADGASDSALTAMILAGVRQPLAGNSFREELRDERPT